MVLKDVQDLPQVLTDRQKSLRDEQLAEEGRDRKGMEVFGALAKQISTKILDDHYEAIQENRKFEIEKQRLDHTASINKATAAATEQETIRKETRAKRLEYMQQYSKANSARVGVRAAGRDKALAVLMKWQDEFKLSGGTGAAGAGLDKRIAAQGKLLKSLRGPVGSPETPILIKARADLGNLIAQRDRQQRFTSSPKFRRVMQKVKGLMPDQARLILGSSGLVENWMDLQEKVHRAEMRMARTMFDSVEQGTDRITFPEYVDAHIRATEGNQAAPGQEASADEDDLVIGQNTPTDVKDSLFAGEFDPPGTTPSKEQGSNRSVGTGRGTSPDLAKRRAEKNRAENDANFYRTRVQRYTTPEKTDDYFGVDLPEPRTGNLTETEFNKSHTGVTRGLRAFRQSGNDNAIRGNLGLRGFNAAAKLRTSGTQEAAGAALQKKLEANLKSAQAVSQAKSGLRQQILGLVEANVLKEIFSTMGLTDAQLTQIAKGNFNSLPAQEIAAAMSSAGMDEPLMKELQKDPEFKAAVAQVKASGKAVTGYNIAAILFWKTLLSTDDLAELRKAAKARVKNTALVKGVEIPDGKGGHDNLDLRDRDHLDWVLRDAIADEIEANTGLQEVARAVALGRFNKGNSLVASAKQTQRTFKSLLSQAMAMPNIQAAYKTLLMEGIEEDGKITEKTYSSFMYDVRGMLVTNLEDQNLAGMYDVLRSLGITK